MEVFGDRVDDEGLGWDEEVRDEAAKFEASTDVTSNGGKGRLERKVRTDGEVVGGDEFTVDEELRESSEPPRGRFGDFLRFTAEGATASEETPIDAGPFELRGTNGVTAMMERV